MRSSLTRLAHAIAFGCVLVPCAALGGDVLIANGLAPPNPANVLDDATHAADTVFVRNDGCSLPPSSCSSPTATTVHLTSGADVDQLDVRDTSIVEMFASATLTFLSMPTGSTSVTISGGAITDAPTSVSGLIGDFTMTGGTLSGGVTKGGTIEIAGGSVASLTVNATGVGIATVSGGTVTGDVLLSNNTSLIFSSGTIGGNVSTGQFSSVEMSGGTLEGNAILLGADSTLSGGNIEGNTSILAADVTLSGTALAGFLLISGATVEMSAGSVGGDVSTGNGATLVWRGGSWSGTARAADTSVIEIVGSNFEVDGFQVPFGDLSAQNGTLTGIVAGAGAISVPFVQGGGSDPQGTFDGTIRLVSPVPGPGLLLRLACALMVAGSGAVLLQRTRR